MSIKVVNNSIDGLISDTTWLENCVGLSCGILKSIKVTSQYLLKTWAAVRPTGPAPIINSGGFCILFNDSIMRLEGVALSKINKCHLNEILEMLHWNSFVEWYGDEHVMVTNCEEQHFNSHCAKQMTVEEFFKSNEILYLKDWHFEKMHQIALPCTVKEDWLNEHFIEDDFKFLYLGKKDSWTPIHTDVFHSHSWSLNLIGCKLWYFFSPCHPHFSKVINSFDARQFNESISFVSYPGDVVWVPTGWAHQVHNLDEPTLSYNRNWCDGDNILKITEFLLNEFHRVKLELHDIPMSNKDRCIEEHKVFTALTGISISEFINWMNEMYLKCENRNALIAKQSLADLI